jgi:hypothetical protein
VNKHAAALGLVLHPVELLNSFNTKYTENKTVPKWLVDQIMIAILSCITVNQNKNFLNIAPPSEGTILQIQKQMQLQLHASQEGSPSNLNTSSNSDTTQFKLHNNMDEDTWTCTSSLSMRLHIRFFLCREQTGKTKAKINAIQIN